MGLSEEEALSSLTTIPARLIKINKFLGTLEEGKIANFLITSGNIFKDGEIYENWVAGKKNVIKNPKRIDVRGYYKLNSKEFKDEAVVIKGSKEKPKTTISFLDSSILNTFLEGTQITLATKNGLYRMIGHRYLDSIIGKYQNILGEYIDFIMIRDSLIKIKNKEIVENFKPTLPGIWFPNKSYGFENKHPNIS